MHLAFLKVVLHLWQVAKPAVVSTCVPCRCKCQWCGVDTGVLILLPVVCCVRWVSGFTTRLCVCPSEMILSVSPQSTGENAWSIVMAGGGHRSWFLKGL